LWWLYIQYVCWLCRLAGPACTECEFVSSYCGGCIYSLCVDGVVLLGRHVLSLILCRAVVVAVYTVYTLMVLSCWAGMYCVWFCVELLWWLYIQYVRWWCCLAGPVCTESDFVSSCCGGCIYSMYVDGVVLLGRYVLSLILCRAVVVALYTVCMLMVLSCWAGMYWVWVCVELLWWLYIQTVCWWFCLAGPVCTHKIKLKL